MYGVLLLAVSQFPILAIELVCNIHLFWPIHRFLTMPGLVLQAPCISESRQACTIFYMRLFIRHIVAYVNILLRDQTLPVFMPGPPTYRSHIQPHLVLVLLGGSPI